MGGEQHNKQVGRCQAVQEELEVEAEIDLPEGPNDDSGIGVFARKEPAPKNRVFYLAQGSEFIHYWDFDGHKIQEFELGSVGLQDGTASLAAFGLNIVGLLRTDADPSIGVELVWLDVSPIPAHGAILKRVDLPENMQGGLAIAPPPPLPPTPPLVALTHPLPPLPGVFVSDTDGNVHWLHPDGKPFTTFGPFGGPILGLGFDGHLLWISMPTHKMIHGMDLSGKIVKNVDFSQLGKPGGMDSTVVAPIPLRCDVGGVVVNANNASPVVGAKAILKRRGHGGAHRQTKTDRDGKFLFTDVEEGPAEILVIAKHFKKAKFKLDIKCPMDEIPIKLYPKKGKGHD